MLKQRVITALILAAVLLASLASSHEWPFAALTLIFIAAAGWEWSRLNQAPGMRAWITAAAVAGGCVYFAQVTQLPVWGPVTAPAGQALVSGLNVNPHVHAWGLPLAGFHVATGVWFAAALIWVLGGGLALRYGNQSWLKVPEFWRRTLGLALLVIAWLALVELKVQGLNLLLSCLCLVWAADIGAYFGGRAFGRRKLAPTISPGKSWEGVWSGLVAVCLLAAGWMWIDQNVGVDSPSLYSRLWMGLGPIGTLLALAFLVAMSVVGDLFESLMKRQAGVKDSSQLLPGHGGVLDRIDALLPALPLSLAVLSLCHA